MLADKNKYALGRVCNDAVRYWLTALLIMIPFVTSLYELLRPWNPGLAAFVNRLDELTLIILLLPAVFEFYKNCRNRNEYELLSLLLFLPIALLTACGIISGVLNGNNLMITGLGVFAYVKYFLFIFIYAAYFRDFSMFLKTFRIILIVAIVIGLVAFLQELWVLFRGFFEVKSGHYNEMYMLMNKLLGVEDVKVYGSGWRLGIFRTSSLVSHYNLLGLYSLLILTIYLNITKRVNVLVIFSLLSGIVTSVSRTAYIGFLLLGGQQTVKGRKWMIVFCIPLLIALLFILKADDNVEMSMYMNEEGNDMEFQENLTYREFAGGKALQVWRDYPVWGVGPGMFGGSVAYKFSSPYYQEYNFQMIMNWFHSLDQLWPQVLAEIGLVGAGMMSAMFITLLTVFYALSRNAASDEKRGFFNGMITFTVIFLFYTFAGNLNIVSLLLPFCAFAGIGLGCERLQPFNDIERK